MDEKVLYSANDTLNKLQDQGKKVFYVTNNSTKSREEFLTKCDRLGFKAEKVIKFGVPLNQLN
jgi:ribonucleotide monophosphatase NagD (HAD superfamily)